jgi:hypothetical protein
MQSLRYTLALALALAASLGLAQRAAADDPPPCPGEQNPGCVWKNTDPVVVKFNPALDPTLEQVRRYVDPMLMQQAYTLGNADTRWMCFQKAVDAWNAVLDTLCTGQRAFQLQAMRVNNLWGTQQTMQVECVDGGLRNPDDPLLPHSPATGADVFDRTPAYLGDGSNTASTGYGGQKTPAIPPGWIVGNGIGTYTIDARLGETYPRCSTTEPGKMVESDIAWFTHIEDGTMPGACPLIPWDYRYEPVAADPNDPGAPVPYKGAPPKPGPDAFDFYSVMLHELGHLIGLGHMSDPAGGNVMVGSLSPGERSKISATEIACLKQLYCPQPTPARRSTWGGLKVIYR